MQQQPQKRPLPPTPATSTKYTTVNDAIHSLLSDTSYDTLTERERKWYNELSNCHKSLEQKDSTINNLKTIVVEWKRKAVEYESAYKELKRVSEEREQFLIKQHAAELEALSRAQIEQINDNLEVILQLGRENDHLRSLCNDNNEQLSHEDNLQSPKPPQQQQQQQQQQQLPTIENGASTTSQLCNEAEIANRIAKESLKNSSDQDNELLQRINDMVNEMEDTLLDLQHNDYRAESPSANIPALVSDSYSSSSSEGEEDENEDADLYTEAQINPTTHQSQQQPAAEAKKSRSATIPSFLFRHKKLDSDDLLMQKRKVQSLKEPSIQTHQRKPVNTYLFQADTSSTTTS